jgi:hypothetical protein
MILVYDAPTVPKPSKGALRLHFGISLRRSSRGDFTGQHLFELEERTRRLRD